MGELTLRASGPVDPSRAWQRYAEPARWADWAPHLRGVDYPLPRLRANTAGQVCGPWGLRVPFTVERCDEASRTWSWTVHLRVREADVVTVALAHGVVADEGGCATWLRLRGRWPVILGYAPIAQLALRRLVR
ncbi:MAG: hypothetical protein WA962_02765 [Ornithinimicrobium sp.]